MLTNNVTFQGTVNCLTIILKESDDFNSIFEQIDQKIESAGSFFNGASITVKYRGKKLTKEEETKIFDLLVAKSGAKIEKIQEDDEPPKPQSDQNSKSNSSGKLMNSFISPNEDENPTKFHKGTIRSGGLINFDGNVIIMGDVNPGGEVVATGNIIVLGTLRGTVHAGAKGNKEASILALNLQPTQIRIADMITRSPDDKETTHHQFDPEIAYIKDNIIYIERYMP